MRLELGDYFVEDVVFGSQMRWEPNRLHVDVSEIEGIVVEDPYIARVRVMVARPGDSIRITNVRDVMEPKIKPDGPGVVYPGVAGRPVEMVGSGRTNRLAGMTLMACTKLPQLTAHGSSRWSTNARHQFIDMSGPGAISPYASLVNLCLELETDRDLDPDTWNRSIQSALLRVSDRLAGTTIGIEPPDTEIIDTAPRPDLPGFVFMPVLASAEHRLGSNSSLGTGIYGVTRLTCPWFLSPTEMLDGAAFGTYGSQHYTWPLTNSLPFHMARNHGREYNFLGCVLLRSNWESQAEKQLMANRAAHLAASVGANGSIVTTNVRGQRFAETVLTVQACERAGINVVLLTEEEDDENGTASPILIPVPELASVVSTGTGGAPGPFGPVKEVIGGFGDSSWYDKQPPIHGRYGVSHTADVYGFTRESCVDY